MKWKTKGEKDRKIYIAYGSNLNTDQMKQRCPDSEILGTGYIDDYELLFKQIGIDRGSFLTIEKKKGAKVPVTLYSISEDDEKSLDKCEEYPTTYYKKDMVIPYTDNNGVEKETNAFTYIMHENKPLGDPSKEYVKRVLDGYKTFNFDTQILQRALEQEEINE